MEIQNNIQKGSQYNALIEQIGSLLQQGRKHAAYAVNNILVQTYWQIGKYIVEFEQGGAIKAEYGNELLLRLSKDLTQAYGKGFSRSNLFNIRLFYIKFSKIQTLSGLFGETLSRQLNWSHYVEILKADSELEISFYTTQCEKENWSVRELKRQMNSLLFHRLALSKDKEGVLKLAEKGTEIQKPEDILKEPFVLEFLGIPQQEQYLESELEERLIKNLEAFLLELGKGFAFVKRQYRVPVNNRNFSVDLVFYHIILKCYILIDLKRGEIEHSDIGQMNFYLNYFRKEVNIETDNEPIGIVLGAYKDNIMVEYAMDNINNQLFVSKYQLYLPNKEELRNIINRQLEYEDIH
ncbi:MAG: PDDEXK nuclease domain-containing protein [Candidatus Symbiothrix sp.]|jgi:predicted nuclease of restriction endonuclease-like (RecB) superfamily|nr:PDDEXK nuclease domain-containing protein [Candidatus Symbiothrix sp.]